MSLNLLSTSPDGTSRFSKKYVTNAATASDRAFFTCEYDRMIYTGIERTSTNPHQLHMQSFNIQTGETTYIGYVTKAQLNNRTNKRISSFLCDGKYAYVTLHSGEKEMYRINLNNLSDVTWYSMARSSTCWFRSYWYDRTTIVVMDARGLAYFHTDTLTWTYENYKPSDITGRSDFAWCDKMIADVDDNLAIYNRDTQTFTTISFPISSYDSEVCYGEGKFWVVNQAYVFSYDVETEAWDAEYTPVPFKHRPKSIYYTEGLLYILPGSTADNNRNKKIWVFETQRKKFAYTYLPWNITTDYDAMVTMAFYHKYCFLQYYSFGILNYEGLYKYNIGYKINQFSIITNDTLEYESKDPWLKLNPSYLSFEAATDDREFEYIPGTTMKSVAVNKRDYKTIYDIGIKLKE